MKILLLDGWAMDVALDVVPAMSRVLELLVLPLVPEVVAVEVPEGAPSQVLPVEGLVWVPEIWMLQVPDLRGVPDSSILQVPDLRKVPDSSFLGVPELMRVQYSSMVEVPEAKVPIEL